MIRLVWVPVGAVLLAFAAALLARRLSPPVAVRLLRLTIAAAAVAVLIPLLGSGLGWLVGHPLVVDWVRFDGRRKSWIDGLVGPVAAVLLAVGLVRVGLWHRRESTLLRLLPVSGDQVVNVVDTDMPLAVASPAGGGTIIVSTGLWNRLSELERQAVIAHEQAHLQLHHSRVLRIAGIATAAIPVLYPVRRALVFAVERHADETAALSTGDRRVLARAVTVAALAGTAQGMANAQSIGAGPTELRVRALLNTPVRDGLVLQFFGTSLVGGVVAAATAQTMLLGTFAIHLSA